MEKHLTRLEREGYLDHEELKTGGPKGLHFYTLTRKGARALKLQNFRPATKSELRERALPHTRASNDTMIQLLKIGGVTGFLTDYEMRQQPMDGVIADGLVVYTGERCIHLEVDLGNSRQDIEDKVSRLVPYAVPTGTTVLYVAPTEKRLTDLKEWIWEQLVKMGAEEHHEVFCFAVLGAGCHTLRHTLRLQEQTELPG